MTVRVRVAPSPTGDPHVGTAYIALYDYVFARQQRGKFILRIEDTDRTRSTLESERMIMESLHWLGLDYDEGPDVGGPYGPYRQSERSEVYSKYSQMLLESGHAYRCFCTPQRLGQMRKEQEKAKLPPKYDGRCRGLSTEEVQKNLDAGLPHVVRLAVPRTGETSFADKVRGVVTIANEQIDDQVLIKSDGFPTYHLANVVDDHLMEITHVIRAEEWISSTPKHVLLYEAFGWHPPEFIHMPLLRNPDKSKISKRRNPVSLIWFREEGYLPEALLNFLGNMGYSFSDGREIFTLDEMIADFSWERVGKTGPIFDFQKLDHFNGTYIRKLSVDELADRLLATALKDANPAEMAPWAVKDGALDRSFLLMVVPLVQERMEKLNRREFDDMADFFFVPADKLVYDPALLVPKKQPASAVAPMLEKAAAALAAVDRWDLPTVEDRLRTLSTDLGWKAGDLFMTIRIAITGKKASPPLVESMVVLGKEESVRRVKVALERSQAI